MESLMTVYEVQDRSTIAPLFVNYGKAFIQSYFQGYTGNGYTDNLDNPQSAVIVVGEFYFFAGNANQHLISFRPFHYISDYAIMVPPNQQWNNLIEQIYGKRAQRFTRYAFEINTKFDIDKLEQIVMQLPKQYQLKMIDQKLYDEIVLSDWCRDLCINFKSYNEFKRLGIGVVLLKNDMIVAGASSYVAYKEGIEIEIDTIESERHKGLALVCGAKLILACLSRNIYPNWDAHNHASLNLALKLGYRLDKSYAAYIIGY